jgi:hypothetical protein
LLLEGGLAVNVGVFVFVEVGVAVGVLVLVGVKVGVNVGVKVGVNVGVNVGVLIIPAYSTAPISQLLPCGRTVPNWSVAGHPEEVPVLRAGLLANGMCTSIAPVKLLSICGSTFRLLLPLVMEHAAMFSIIL